MYRYNIMCVDDYNHNEGETKPRATAYSDKDGRWVEYEKVKKILEECIGKEDKHHPLADEKLTEILKEKGYNIARRTVAKYREAMNIPVARLRKEL